MLVDSSHGDRVREPGGLEHGGGDVNHMVEVRTNLAARDDAARPVDDRAVAGAAPVGSDLLGPLVGRVHGVCPADCVVVVGGRGAELVDARSHKFGCLEPGGAVEMNVSLKEPLTVPSAEAPLSPMM